MAPLRAAISCRPGTDTLGGSYVEPLGMWWVYAQARAPHCGVCALLGRAVGEGGSVDGLATH